MNRADAIELDGQAKKDTCRKCTGLNMGELSRKARMWDKSQDTKEMQEFLINTGEFLIKAMGQLSGDAYIAAEMKLADIIEKL